MRKAGALNFKSAAKRIPGALCCRKNTLEIFASDLQRHTVLCLLIAEEGGGNFHGHNSRSLFKGNHSLLGAHSLRLCPGAVEPAHHIHLSSAGGSVVGLGLKGLAILSEGQRSRSPQTVENHIRILCVRREGEADICGVGGGNQFDFHP